MPDVEWHFTTVKCHFSSVKCHFSSVKCHFSSVECHSADDPQCFTVEMCKKNQKNIDLTMP